jgi:hypothetical protein
MGDSAFDITQANDNDDNRTTCSNCGYSPGSASLCIYRDQRICYSCLLQLQGKPNYERHHVLGRDYPDTIPLWANLHRDITATQQKWPEVLRHPDNPLLITAAIMRSVGDFAAWLAQHCERISDWLIGLWRLLEEHQPGWQEQLPPLWRTV